MNILTVSTFCLCAYITYIKAQVVSHQPETLTGIPAEPVKEVIGTGDWNL